MISAPSGWRPSASVARAARGVAAYHEHLRRNVESLG
jgi:hypothetical protein